MKKKKKSKLPRWLRKLVVTDAIGGASKHERGQVRRDGRGKRRKARKRQRLARRMQRGRR